ncbi:MAG TPA: hypothetical protein VGH42_12515 [Verrucomicrobiae bacterium]|jgi:hypothetical protein
MNATDSNPPAALSESRERKIILLLCCAAAVHVFVFSCVFPFFNNVDEQFQYDLVVKYSQGRIPSKLEKLSAESAHYFTLYNTPEYFESPANYPGGQFPPPLWTQPAEKIRQVLAFGVPFWQKIMTNYESSQAPLYYAVAGFWWRVGQLLGIEGGRLLYWLHFLNIFFVVALVWLGHAAARTVFPGQNFLRLGVPAMLAFFPQSAFYAVQNDVLSPLCFGAAFICLLNFLRAEIPGARLGTATGLMLAAVFLTKMTNLPLIAVAAAVVILKIRRLVKAGNFRAALPSLISLALCAGLPMEIWMTWCKSAFGDFTGTAVKIHYLHWTHKSFGEWWPHPIFTPHGLWIFVSELTGTFWQGEIWWHHTPLASPFLDALYTILSLIFVGIALAVLLPRFAAATQPQREALWIGFWNFAGLVALFAFLSVSYDFHDCPYPSREHPYFTSGRLMLGVLIPFLLLFVYGIDRALKKSGDRTKFLALAGMILFMLVSEVATDWPVFSSQYNWFHL